MDFEIQIPPFNPLCIIFPDDMLFRRNEFAITLPIVCMEIPYWEISQFFHQTGGSFNPSVYHYAMQE
nr:hypothetical protein [Desulfobacter curvatus]